MKNNVLNKVLAHSKKTKTIIGLRKYDDNEDLLVGHVIDYNDTLILLQQLTVFGLDDGIITIETKAIETIETEDSYVTAYQYLSENTDKIKAQTVIKLSLPKKKNWQYELISELSVKKKMIAIELADSLIHGFIIDFDEHYLNFNSIGNTGQDEGRIIYKLNEILSVSIDELSSRKRQAFYEWHNEKIKVKNKS